MNKTFLICLCKCIEINHRDSVAMETNVTHSSNHTAHRKQIKLVVHVVNHHLLSRSRQIQYVFGVWLHHFECAKVFATIDARIVGSVYKAGHFFLSFSLSVSVFFRLYKFYYQTPTKLYEIFTSFYDSYNFTVDLRNSRRVLCAQGSQLSCKKHVYVWGQITHKKIWRLIRVHPFTRVVGHLVHLCNIINV